MKVFIESLLDNLIVFIVVWDFLDFNIIQQIDGVDSVLFSFGVVVFLLFQVREVWLFVGYKGFEKLVWIQQ